MQTNKRPKEISLLNSAKGVGRVGARLSLLKDLHETTSREFDEADVRTCYQPKEATKRGLLSFR